MKTLDETKSILIQYRDTLKTCEDNIYVIKGNNMTLHRTGYNKYELINVDWPSTFKKDAAKEKLRIYKPKYELIGLEMVLYKDWLKSSIKKLEKIIKSTDIPVTETYMTDFLHIDHPELVEEEEEEVESQEAELPYVSGTQYRMYHLNNPNCEICNNCLVCKFLHKVTFDGDCLVVDCVKKL